jgi:hypothetical protein
LPQSQSVQKYVKKKAASKKKKARTTYIQYDLSKEETFSLLDAMR